MMTTIAFRPDDPFSWHQTLFMLLLLQSSLLLLVFGYYCCCCCFVFGLEPEFLTMVTMDGTMMRMMGTDLDAMMMMMVVKREEGG